MKKYFFVLLCTAVAFTSCNGNDPDQGDTKFAGCLNGRFSVAEGKYVRFSIGNLQYTQSTKTWSFAEHQYDFIGTDNVTGGTVESDEYGYNRRGEALADKIDLFGWSGSTGSAKWGIGISRKYEDYSGDFVDWGQNPITNGGNKANQWRTLTKDEWEYILKGRPNASALLGMATVDAFGGVILLPDGWKQPDGISFKSGCSEVRTMEAYGVYQSFTAAEWQKLESAGAVFLPASGSRTGLVVNNVAEYCSYWSATPDYEGNALRFGLYSGAAGVYTSHNYFGMAVRLVQDAE